MEIPITLKVADYEIWSHLVLSFGGDSSEQGTINLTIDTDYEAHRKLLRDYREYLTEESRSRVGEFLTKLLQEHSDISGVIHYDCTPFGSKGRLTGIIMESLLFFGYLARGDVDRLAVFNLTKGIVESAGLDIMTTNPEVTVNQAKLAWGILDKAARRVIGGAEEYWLEESVKGQWEPLKTFESRQRAFEWMLKLKGKLRVVEVLESKDA